MSSRPVLVSAAAVVVAASAAGLLWHGSGSAATGLGPAQVVAEYRQELARLQLAPGWRLPPAPTYSEVGPDGAAVRYGKGIGASLADTYWFCSWASRALSAETSPAVRRAALRRLERVRDTVLFHSMVPSDREAFFAIVPSAARGDDSGLREWAKANCPPAAG